MLFSAMFSPARLKSRLESWIRRGPYAEGLAAREISIQVGAREASARLDPNPSAGRLLAVLPVRARGKRIDSLLVIRQALALHPAGNEAAGDADSSGAEPGRIFYWIQKQVLVINVGRTPRTLDPSGHFIPLGRMMGKWRPILSRVRESTHLRIVSA